jgi:Gas vesicle protein
MNHPVWTGPSSTRSPSREAGHAESANLADILERVLDKGIVIAGDIRIDLLDIELLTIKIRLIVASVDRAREMGIDWWEHDPMLSSGERDVLEENERLRRRIGDLEAAEGRERAAALEPDERHEPADGAGEDPPAASGRGRRREPRREQHRESRGEARQESRRAPRRESRPGGDDAS